MPPVLRDGRAIIYFSKVSLATGFSRDLIVTNQKLSQNLIWNSVLWGETQSMRSNFAQIDYGREGTMSEPLGVAEDSR